MRKLILLNLFLFSYYFSNATNIVVSDSISVNTNWIASNCYFIKGIVYVTSGTTLIIDAGTFIRGDKATKGTLVIERGAKIIANGTALNPIMFTSSQPQGSRTYGDWGGIVICGKAPVNWLANEAQIPGLRSYYGGLNPTDNSGKLSYVRIEFAGAALSPNNELPGLMLAGVGNTTQIDHIQVSISGDDAFAWYGGTVNCKYLVAHRTWDDDFDTDNGYKGKVQFFVAQRDPNVADNSGSKAFESDSYGPNTKPGINGDTTGLTRPTFVNGTLIGPMTTPTSKAYDALLFTAGMHIRRGSGLSCFNTILAGWPSGILIDDDTNTTLYGSTTFNIGNGAMQFKGNIIAGIGMGCFPKGVDPNANIIYITNGARSLTGVCGDADSATKGNTNWSPFAGPFTWLQNPSFGNTQYANFASSVRLTNPFDLTNPSFLPLASSPVCNGTLSPDFTGKAADAFFDKVNYIGAFGCTGQASDNWMAGWTNFDPNNTWYDMWCTGDNVNKIATSLDVRISPNPASITADVSVAIPFTTEVNIVLLDITSRKIKEIFRGTAAAGEHNYDINLDGLSKGLYYVTIVSGDIRQNIKLVVE
ncbi:MAG: T9SS type A sorting domain-containing protein [Bacteroidetes bacterium]|nr:T9SS type A sorting domain-containing protein [Bacteroidota bacterium]